MHQRPDRISYYMGLASQVAQRSTCERAMVGAVLVADKRIVSTGYNGSPPGAKHCLDEGCMIENNHCIRTVHAEMNAILYLEHKYENMILYCTHQPCFDCYKALTVIGVNTIYYSKAYADNRRTRFINDLGPFAPQMLAVIPKGDSDA